MTRDYYYDLFTDSIPTDSETSVSINTDSVNTLSSGHQVGSSGLGVYHWTSDITSPDLPFIGDITVGYFGGTIFIYRNLDYPLSPNTTYHWTFTITPEGSDTETYNFSFTTESTLSKPTTPTPANSSGPGINFSGFQLSWVDGGGATKYDVYIGGIKVSTHQPGTSYVTSLSQVPYNQVINWQVNAFDDDENEVDGDLWTFDARPAKVTYTAPANTSIGQRLYPTYTWGAADQATTYTFNVSV
jgi:hypothetical protein